MHFTDDFLLKFVVSRHFKVDDVVRDIMLHLPWRKNNIPLALLNQSGLKLLSEGIIHIHGRNKQGSPIMIVDFAKMIDLINKKILDSATFCNLYHFLANYILRNMMVPG